jgi:enoyl-CoA hydratase/carnithine racemase
VRAKVSAIRSLALEGHRFTPPEARDAGLVDEIVSGGTQAVIKRAREIAEEKAPKAREGVWGVIKVHLSQCRMHKRVLTGSLMSCTDGIVSPLNGASATGNPNH